MKRIDLLPSRSAVTRAAWSLAITALPCGPASALDLAVLDNWRSILPRHGGWILLAGVGLIAVALAALTVRRPRSDRAPIDDEPFGRMREDAPARALPRVAVEGSPADAAPSLESIEETPQFDPVPLPGPVRRDTPPEPPQVAENGSHLFLALHHVDLSIDVLRKHIERESRPMPSVWLMLLDLSRTHQREQTFRELALEFHRRFNVCTPSWEGFPPGRDDPGLEAYPRLVKEITQAWGTHECRRLLDRLLYDNRGSQRRGFTLNAYNDLIALRRAADAVVDAIEQDLVEEAKVRDAFASASAEMNDSQASTSPAARSPLVSDLESQLDSDLRADVAPQSAIEREHPALAGMLAREWGNAAMSARLCEMLARGGDGPSELSSEASEELELLRRMAERLSAVNGIALAGATRE